MIYLLRILSNIWLFTSVKTKFYNSYNLNSLPRVNLTKNILNNWLQRDLSIIIISSSSRRSFALYIQLYLCTPPTPPVKILMTPFWTLHGVTNNTGEDSLWYFIPCNIFKKCSGLQFLLKCNYSPSRLPIKMSNFHRQALLAWNLLYVHNFSPHKALLWNNKDITIKNKSVFLPSRHSKGIFSIIDLFHKHGNLLSYNDFLSTFEFPIRFKKFRLVCQAIPSGTIQLMKYHLSHSTNARIDSKLIIDGRPLLDKKCNNKFIRNAIYAKKKCFPRRKLFWNELINDTDFKKAWLLPYTFWISKKIKNIQFKILHKIYPCNVMLSKFMDMDNKCVFCDMEESIAYAFCECNVVHDFWMDFFSVSYLFTKKMFFVILLTVIICWIFKHFLHSLL